MNILVPMVQSNTMISDDARFIKALYEIRKKTILEYIIERLSSIPDASVTFVIRQSDARDYHIDKIIKLLLPDANIVTAKGGTQGAACSCLLAIDHIDNAEPLLIAGSDQIINVDLADVIRHFIESPLDGAAVILDDVHPKWSFVKLDENDMVVEAAEKVPISRNACAGYYYFREGRVFAKAAMKMISTRGMTNGQYYVCPVFNEMIIEGRQIGIYRIDKKDHYSLTSEQGVAEFEDYVSQLAIR